jgi:aryl-alcohol dehydrogenase-like predicted oxidoreductase
VGFSFAYHATNPVGDEDAPAVIRRAAELGQTFLDTSDVYGPHTNEQLLCAYLALLSRVILHPCETSFCQNDLIVHDKWS